MFEDFTTVVSNLNFGPIMAILLWLVEEISKERLVLEGWNEHVSSSLELAFIELTEKLTEEKGSLFMAEQAVENVSLYIAVV